MEEVLLPVGAVEGDAAVTLEFDEATLDFDLPTEGVFEVDGTGKGFVVVEHKIRGVGESSNSQHGRPAHGYVTPTR